MRILMLILTIFSLYSYSQVIEGVDYRKFTGNPTIPNVSNKTNVIEFFSYACIHCAAIESQVNELVKNTKNINFMKIQVVWGNYFMNYAKLYATVDTMKLHRQLDEKIFNAILMHNNPLETTEELNTFLVANGVDTKKFMNVYNSFNVSTKPQQAARYTKSYNINGTPTFVIDNKYVTMPLPPERLLQVINELIQKVKRS